MNMTVDVDVNMYSPQIGTVALKVALDTLMTTLEPNSHTNIARWAMKIVNTKALSNPTYAAVMAVVYCLARVIIPEFALFTIVASNSFATCWIDAVLPSRLN
ncbi:hypothetical protein BSLG_000366 [Batrachochytrium salamandrivorans]|nr:hypothetical protein BSLG_000366 [Batrachochytrium salamandrivorans]